MTKNLLISLAVVLLTACTHTIKSTHVWLTSDSGDKCREKRAVSFFPLLHSPDALHSNNTGVYVNLSDQRQVIDGFGGSLTESSAFVLATLPADQREAILEELFSENGANFSVARTQVGASDFSVEGRYSLAEKEGDTALESFSLYRDKEGFPKDKYPLIQDENYDLFNLMTDVWNIKQSQSDKVFKLMASAWTAPAWMKENGKYYERENGFHRGGALLKEHYQTYADYLVRYLEAYRDEGISFWAMTPVNEPMGNDGGWESMDMSADEEALFIGDYLGPTLGSHGFSNVEVFGFDQNIGELPRYAEAIYGMDQAKTHTAGMAIHWYGSTVSCLPEVLDQVHNTYPDKRIFHSEGCIDNLGCPPWDAVTDKAGFVESDWFMNDDFWWSVSATDWAYSTPYDNGNHPAYVPVHRYAQYIIDGLNHWMTGFCDWNIVLDEIGGPNHVSNFCGAQVMVDAANEDIYFTPYYYVLKQFSRSMRPGDIVLGVNADVNDKLHVCAVRKHDGSIAVNMLNTGKDALIFPLQIDDHIARVQLPANSVETIIVKL